MTTIDRLNAELDEFPSFMEVHEMGDRLAPLADFLDALGFDNDAEIIRRIIDPQSTVAQLRDELRTAVARVEELEAAIAAHRDSGDERVDAILWAFVEDR